MSTSTTDGLERQAWIALASVPGVGDITFGQLLATYVSASAALEAVAGMRGSGADAQLARRLGMRTQSGLAEAIRVMAKDPAQPIRRMEQLGGWVLMPLDAEYPPQLHELEYPPAVIFGIGRADVLVGSRMVAVVGTRRPTAAGRDLAGRVAGRLVEASATVVSGLAVGIDGAAHLATLDSGGITVAVIGSGPEAPGPIGHRRLAKRIAQHGAVIGELAPGAKASRGTFPRRNRIISALASTTIVIEAPRRSGALITARLALEQGRDLIVAPGRPLDPSVAGCLAMLRESPARPLVGLDEMIADLGFDDSLVVGREPQAARLSSAGALALLGDQERAVAVGLTAGPRTVDSLVATTGLSAGVVAGALTILQLRGWARVHGAMQIPAGPLLDDLPRGGS